MTYFEALMIVATLGSLAIHSAPKQERIAAPIPVKPVRKVRTRKA